MLENYFIILSVILICCTDVTKNEKELENTTSGVKDRKIYQAIVDTIRYDDIQIGTIKLLDNKEMIIKKFGDPDSLSTFYNELDEIYETVLHYSSNLFYLVDSKLVRFVIKTTAFSFGAVEKINVGDGCTKLQIFSTNPCKGEELKDTQDRGLFFRKTFFISHNGKLIDNYLDFILKDSKIYKIELRE